MDDTTHELDALAELADPEVARSLEGILQSLEKETEILLFMGAHCTVCPHQLRSVATVALASPNVVLDVVETSHDPDLAARYEVRSVPTTVVDDELIMVGVVQPAELAFRLVERQGPEYARRVFAATLGSGRLDAAAERLADGRGTEAFLELWQRSGTEENGLKQREILKRTAEESLLYDPEGLAPVVPTFLAGLEDGGALADDDDLRADTAELLGRIGDPSARPTLERLAHDPDRFVARAAAGALADLDADDEW